MNSDRGVDRGWLRRSVRAFTAGVAVMLWLAGCGGGSDDTTALRENSAGPVVNGTPVTITLSPPQTIPFSNRLALAWTSGAFTGSLFVRIELGLSFFPGQSWTLQHNAPAVIYQVSDIDPSTGASRIVRFEFRYQGGFFLLTALDDNDVGANSGPFGVDIYPSNVRPVSPELSCDFGDSPCYNGYAFFPWFDWPKRAGESLSFVIPRADPAGLTYSVLLKPNESEGFQPIAEGISGLSATVDRRAAWALDFPTARLKVRGCDTANRCAESAEQPLRAALRSGVVEVTSGDQTNAHVAVSADGNVFAFKSRFLGSDEPPAVFVYRRDEQGRWSTDFNPQNAAPGFGRTFTLSGDGTSLAVEASLCAAGSTVCSASVVFVYRRQDGDWIEQKRIDAVREPRLSHDGNRLATIGLVDSHPARLRVFTRTGQAWSEDALPALAYRPLDIELSGDGATLAAAREGSLVNPCGCRAIEVYSLAPAVGWRASGTLHSKKHSVADSSDDDGFGVGLAGSHSLAVSADGSVIAVGASFDAGDANDTTGDPKNRGAARSGAIYVFRLSNGTWQHQAFLKPRGAAAQDNFGHQVALSGDGHLLFGGARGLAANVSGLNRNQAEDQPVAPNPGAQSLEGAAAYAFTQDGSGTWTERTTVVPQTSGHVRFSDAFSVALSANGMTLVLGATDVLPAGSATPLSKAFVY
jgi:hypothetical protein